MRPDLSPRVRGKRPRECGRGCVDRSIPARAGEVSGTATGIGLSPEMRLPYAICQSLFRDHICGECYPTINAFTKWALGKGGNTLSQLYKLVEVSHGNYIDLERFYQSPPLRSRGLRRSKHCSLPRVWLRAVRLLWSQVDSTGCQSCPMLPVPAAKAHVKGSVTTAPCDHR